MKQITKALLRQLGIAIFIYFFIYLCKSFVVFEFTNPFQWIIDIPKYSTESRLIILCVILTYYIASSVFIYSDTY